MDLTLLKRALNASRDGMIITGGLEEDCPIIYVNPAFERLSGYTLEELKGKNCRVLQGEESDKKTISEIHDKVHHGEPCQVRILNYYKDKKKKPFWNSLSISAIRDDNNTITHFVGVQNDVTRLVEEEEKLSQVAMHDFLTGLLNSRGFYESAQQLLDQSSPHTSFVSFIFIDIDHFKPINDLYGHIVGDEVLKLFSEQLQQLVGPQTLVGRVGGDEFAICARHAQKRPEQLLNDLELAKNMAIEKLLDLNIPFSISVGVYTLPSQIATDIKKCMVEADKNMYAKKRKAAITSE